MLFKIRLEAFPNGDDFWIIGDSAQDKGFFHPNTGMLHMAFPMKSKRTSDVGAMTLAERASRKILSKPRSFRKAAPPQTLIQVSVTDSADSAAAAFTSIT